MTFPAYDLVSEELARARANHRVFASTHEAWAVLMEEVDELWDWVRRKSVDRSAAVAWTECVQIAAMAMAFAIEVEPLGGTISPPPEY